MESIKIAAETLKTEASRAAEGLCGILNDISKLAEAHINELPETELWGEADEKSKKRGVSLHYKFVGNLSRQLSQLGEQREELLNLSEKLDELSSLCEYELLAELLSVGTSLLEMQRKIIELEDMSGRFVAGLDRFSDATHKGERADFRSAKRIVREYFDFVCKTCLYIDNLKKI